MKEIECEGIIFFPSRSRNNSKDFGAKYEPANLKQITRKSKHLNKSIQRKLLKVLRKLDPMFDGQWGQWTGEPYDIELKQGAKPYHARPFSVPKCSQQTLKEI